jgi:hypothetical protein
MELGKDPLLGAAAVELLADVLRKLTAYLNWGLLGYDTS